MRARFFRMLASAALLSAHACGSPAVGAGTDAPAWMVAARDLPTPVLAGDSTRIVVLDEVRVTIGTKGRRTIRRRQIVRILNRDGRNAATAQIHFSATADKITDFNAWLCQPDGRIRAFNRKDAIEIATAPEALYADTRAAIISATEEAEAGSTFGWEGTLDERSNLGQGLFWLQNPAPVAMARVVVEVPKGWNLSAVVRGLSGIDPVISGSTYTWEVRDIPPFVQEPFGPGWIGSAIHLAYDVRPPRPQPHLVTLQSWAETSAYALQLHEQPARPDAAIAARAHELCAGTSTRWDGIRAIVTFAQKLRYVSIAMDLGTGGGFTPHAATDVLRCGYGDCKDKTTLLRAFLAAEGIRAWPVLCFSGDPTSVRDDWPSPLQFNHVFAAIELGDTEIPDPTFIINHPNLGRVLLFDPTDPHSPVGDFPGYNQGASVLICAPGTTGLTSVPIAPPEKNLLRRRIKVALEPDGAARVGMIERSFGIKAAEVRRTYEDDARLHDDYEKRLLVVHPGARGTRVELAPTKQPNEIALKAFFDAPRFSRVIRDRLLVVSPVVRVEEAGTALPAGPRTQPIILPSNSVDDSTEFMLPKGFAISELGQAVQIERDFGRYELSFVADEESISVRRKQSWNGGVHPASEYEEIRAFTEAIRKAETTPIVLERTSGVSP